MTRLVVVDAVLLGLGAVYAAWVSRVSTGSRINLFSGFTDNWRGRSVGTTASGVLAGGLVLGSTGYAFGIRWANLFVFAVALFVLFAAFQATHNRALDRR